MLYKKIKSYCKENHISLAAFEKRCGLGNGTIKGWISSSPRLDSLDKVSKETGMTIAELLDKN